MLALLNKEHRDRNVSQLFAIAMDFTGPSGAVTRPLSAFLRLAMMGCPALRAPQLFPTWFTWVGAAAERE